MSHHVVTRSRSILAAGAVAAFMATTIAVGAQQRAIDPSLAPHLQADIHASATPGYAVRSLAKDGTVSARELHQFSEPLRPADAQESVNLSSGTVKLISVNAEGAEWIRLSLADVDLPPGAELFLYSPDAPGETQGPFTGRGPDGSGLLWTPAVRGSSAVLEYVVPAGADPEAAAFKVSAAEYGSMNVTPGSGPLTASSGGSLASEVQGYAVNSSAVSALPGGFFQVDWTADTIRPTNDWIGLYAAGAPNTGFISFQYLTGGEAGVAFFNLPLTPGTYEARMFVNNTYTLVATTRPVVVDHVTLVVNKPSEFIGSPFFFTATWSSDTARANNDWIALAPVGAADAGYVAFQYIPTYFTTQTVTSGGTTTISSGAKSFAPPATPGLYELRFYTGGGFTKVATSLPFVVGYSLPAVPTTTPYGIMQPIPWAASSNRLPQDWVGLFRINVADNAYVSWGYTGGGAAGIVPLTFPPSVGRYEPRYFSDDGAVFTRQVTGNAIFAFNPTYTGLAASRTPLVPGGLVRANWSANIASSETDWIGLFPSGAPNSGYVAYQYVQGGLSGTRTFTAPAAGSYELRVFEHNTYDLVRSSPFTVVDGCISAPTPIAFGATVSGTIAVSDCRSAARGSTAYADRYSFTGTAGQQIVISMFGATNPPALDTYLYLIAPDGTVVSEADDAGSTRGSRLPTNGLFSLPQSGSYIIEATMFSPDDVGPYRLTLSKFP